MPDPNALVRRVAIAVLPPALGFVALVVLVGQFAELGTGREVLSLTSFVVLVSFSALAFNWSRVAPTLVSDADAAVIYRVAVDLFLASLLALVATFFAWSQTFLPGLPVMVQFGLFAVHWAFLLLAVLLFLIALLRLLGIAKSLGTG